MNNTKYRLAISLNNQGVDLIRRSCYRQGLICLVDAMTVVKSMEVGRASESLRGDKSLERAIHYMAAPEPLSIESTMQFDVTVVSDMMTFDDVRNMLLSPEQANTAVFIRIEDIGSDETIKEKINLRSAIMLHNTGAAYRIFGWVFSNVGIQSQRPALRLFHSAYTLITHLCADHNDVEDICQVTMISALILQNLVILSRRMELHDDCAVYGQRLRILLETAETLHEIFRKVTWVAEAA